MQFKAHTHKPHTHLWSSRLQGGKAVLTKTRLQISILQLLPKTLPKAGQGETSRLLLGFIFHLAHADLRNRLWNLIPNKFLAGSSRAERDGPGENRK